MLVTAVAQNWSSHSALYDISTGLDHVNKKTKLLCIAVELAALVYAEDKVHLPARTIGLIKDAFVVPLGCP